MGNTLWTARDRGAYRRPVPGGQGRNAPHVYQDSDQVVIKSLMQARLDGESHEDSIKREEEEERTKSMLSSLWQAISSSLQGLMDAATYQTHFARVTAVAMHTSHLIVPCQVPDLPPPSPS